MSKSLLIRNIVNPKKTIRANNKFELIYKIRQAEKLGWKRGEIETTWSGDYVFICRMTRKSLKGMKM